MLTGVEIAGLVLAVLPLLIEALDRYQTGLEKTKAIAGIRLKDRKRLTKKVDGLFSQLQWLQGSLNIHVRRLILAANPDEDLETLPQDYKDDLWSGPCGVNVEAYLARLGGDEAAKTFQGAMNIYQDSCIEIAEHLEGIIRPREADKKDLKALCDLRTRCGGKLRFTQRFGFTLHEKDIDRLTRQLEEKTLSVGAFVDSAANLDKLSIDATTNRSAKQQLKISKYLYSTRKHAYALLNAFNNVWKTDCHHAEHRIFLHLDSRCTSHERLLPAASPFHVLFKWVSVSQTATEVFWQESAIMTNTDGITLPPTTTNQNVLPTVAFDPTSESKAGTEVANACQCITLAKQNGEEICFHLSGDKQLFSSQGMTCQLPQILPTNPKLVSLDDYLHSPAHRKILDRKRIELAAKLACSILQYNETQWIKQGWHKDSIFFFEDTSTFSTAAIDVDHPLISEQLPPTSPSTEWPDPEDTLVELAILLMELYHRKRFEDWLTQDHPTFDQRDLSNPGFRQSWRQYFAQKWYKKLPKAADIHDVIRMCLYPYPLQEFESSWEDDGFRCAFYAHVISPLLSF